MDEHNPVKQSHLRAIRTSVVGVGLAIVTAALISADEPMGFGLFIVTVIVLAYSFVPTLRAS